LHSAIRINNNSLWIGRVTSSLEAKALAEEFGAAAGSEKIFLEMLKRATDPDFGFLYIVFGLKIRFFDSYRSEFRLKDADDGSSPNRLWTFYLTLSRSLSSLSLYIYIRNGKQKKTKKHYLGFYSGWVGNNSLRVWSKKW
jgi:hypothetical protein